jgi:hypothetical protein
VKQEETEDTSGHSTEQSSHQEKNNMKISDFLPGLLTVPSHTQELSPYFGIEKERWEELNKIVKASFMSTPDFDKGAKYIDENFELNGANEVFTVIFMLGNEAGIRKAEGLVVDTSLGTLHGAQLTKMYEAKSFVEEKGLKPTEHLLEQIATQLTIIAHGMLDLSPKKKKKREDQESPMSNKNKFKKGGFDIPQ